MKNKLYFLVIMLVLMAAFESSLAMSSQPSTKSTNNTEKHLNYRSSSPLQIFKSYYNAIKH